MCARLATPMSIMVGVGRGALEGVLIKDAAALERMEKVTTIVVDKTGTLTEGKPSLRRVLPAPDSTREKCCACRGCRARERASARARRRRVRSRAGPDVADRCGVRFASRVGRLGGRRRRAVCSSATRG